jgi:hypothetical protein
MAGKGHNFKFVVTSFLMSEIPTCYAIFMIRLS